MCLMRDMQHEDVVRLEEEAVDGVRKLLVETISSVNQVSKLMFVQTASYSCMYIHIMCDTRPQRSMWKTQRHCVQLLLTDLPPTLRKNCTVSR